MEIGVVVHGPGIIDSGWAIKIIDILSNYGNVHCRLGGTMGRTAVIDAALEDAIDISLKLLPSQSLELFNREGVDIIFLLNYGKSPETGRVFGYKVFNHYFKQISNEDYLATNHKPLYDASVPVIQIERPGEEDGSIISWNTELNEQLSKSRKGRFKLGLGKKNMVESLSFNFEELFDHLKTSLNLVEVTPEEVVSNYFSNNQERKDEEDIEKILRSYDDYDISHYTYRKIHGVSPDENIFINGIVVGYSNGDSIVLVARDGLIVDIINGTIKYHGLEKLGPVDLERVIVKTGLLRKSDDVNPRVLSNKDISLKDTERHIYSGEISEDDYSFKVAYVDHAAYDIYKFKDFDLVVTIGDDTSLVASDILYRFDIPIIGITDGDLDKVVENGFVNEKSTIIEVASGFDDIVGHHIHDKLFLSKDTLEIPFDEEADSPENFKSIMFNVFKSYVIESIKEVVPSFVEKDHEYNVVNSYEGFVEEDYEFEDLDGFIQDLEYGSYEGSNEIYVDEDGSLVEEVYIEDGEVPLEEVYIEYDDVPVEEIFVEHDSDDDIYVEHESVEDIFVEHDDGSIDEIIVEHDDGSIDEIIVEHEPNEEIVYEDAPLEEIFVEHEPNEEIVYEDAPLEEIFVEHDDSVEDIYEDAPIGEVYIEEEYIEEYSEPIVNEEYSEPIVNEEYSEPIVNEESSDEVLTEDIEESVSNDSEDSEEVDESDGWAEYIKEEFGDSDEKSDDSE